MSKFTVSCTWDEVPHLTEEAKAELWASIPPSQRDARAKGIPSLGAGAIYPLVEEDIVIPDFPIPEHYQRGYGMDVGWQKTAAVWGARDPDSGVCYLTSEHYRGEAEPVVHAEAIKGRGKWIPGVVDPAARGRGQKDGVRLLEVYKDLGLDLEASDNAVEAGIYLVWNMLSSGRLKVFASLQNWRAEIRMYRRDEKGQIVKEKDHLMDATRYFALSGIDRMIAPPADAEPELEFPYSDGPSGSWMR